MNGPDGFEGFRGCVCSLGVTTEREIAQNDLSRSEIEKGES